MITMLINNTMKGDPKAWNSLLSLMRAVRLADEAPEDNSHQPLTADDDALVADFLRRNLPNGSDEPSDGGES